MPYAICICCILLHVLVNFDKYLYIIIKHESKICIIIVDCTAYVHIIYLSMVNLCICLKKTSFFQILVLIFIGKQKIIPILSEKIVHKMHLTKKTILDNIWILLVFRSGLLFHQFHRLNTLIKLYVNMEKHN